MKVHRFVTVALLTAVCSSPAALAETFEDVVDSLRSRAREQGLPATVIDASFATIRYLPRVVERDRNQAEFTLDYIDYLRRIHSPERVSAGQRAAGQYAALLSRISRQSGVPQHILLALWGIETNYGQNTGSVPVFSATATLVHDGRRAAFFTDQFLDALRIVATQGIDPQRLLGSWAGAMGHMQFMPSTYRHYAVDGDSDGTIDLWTSVADAHASAAAYLRAHGWIVGERWGRAVTIPAGLDPVRRQTPAALSVWRALGVTTRTGDPLPTTPDLQATLILPSGLHGPAYLAYNNFHVFMRWNQSLFYALAAGELSDTLAGRSPVRVGLLPDPPRFTRAQIETIQRTLAARGLYNGPVDGIHGPQSRHAVTRYQIRNSLPADGYLSQQLYQRITDEHAPDA